MKLLWSFTNLDDDLRKTYLGSFLRNREDLFERIEEKSADLRASGDFLFEAFRLDQERRKRRKAKLPA